MEIQRESRTKPTVARKLEALRAALKQPLNIVEANRAVRQAISRIVLSPQSGSMTIYWQHAEEPSEEILFGGKHMKWEIWAQP
jgi:hypothetical protein